MTLTLRQASGERWHAGDALWERSVLSPVGSRPSERLPSASLTLRVSSDVTRGAQSERPGERLSQDSISWAPGLHFQSVSSPPQRGVHLPWNIHPATAYQLAGKRLQAGTAVQQGARQPVLPLQGSHRVWPMGNPTVQQLLQPLRELDLLCGACCDDRVRRVTGEVNFHVFFRQRILFGPSPFPTLTPEALCSQVTESTGGCFTKQHGTTCRVSLKKSALLQAQTRLPHPRTSKIQYDIIQGNAKLASPQHVSKRCFSLPSPLASSTEAGGVVQLCRERAGGSFQIQKCFASPPQVQGNGPPLHHCFELSSAEASKSCSVSQSRNYFKSLAVLKHHKILYATKH